MTGKLEQEKTGKGGLLREDVHIDEETMHFLKMTNDPVIRPNLLAHLQELGLLSAFLEAETGTT